MKKITTFLICIILMIPALSASGDVPVTFTIRNNTYQDLETVLLNHYSDSPDSLDVNSYGTYSAQVDTPVPSITINGQTATYPLVTLVTLSNGTVARVKWQSSTVVIVDQNEM